jgi:hypothetical protein
MFDEFKKLHDTRRSDSIPYFSFYDSSGNLIRGDISLSVQEDGQFDTLTSIVDGVSTVYQKDEYTYCTGCLYILGIGFLLPGDVVKLHLDDVEEYELNYGWHTNVSGQTIYSWYLKLLNVQQLFEKRGFDRTQQPYITNTGLRTLYKEYLDTIEVVQFKKDRVSFNIL